MDYLFKSFEFEPCLTITVERTMTTYAMPWFQISVPVTWNDNIVPINFGEIPAKTHPT